MILPLAFKLPLGSVYPFPRQGSPQTSVVISTLVVVLNAYSQAMFQRALLLWHHPITMPSLLHRMNMQPPLRHLQPDLRHPSTQSSMGSPSTQPNLHQQHMQPTLQQHLQPQHLHRLAQVFFPRLDDQRQHDAQYACFIPGSGKRATIQCTAFMFVVQDQVLRINKWTKYMPHGVCCNLWAAVESSVSIMRALIVVPQARPLLLRIIFRRAHLLSRHSRLIAKLLVRS